MARTIQSVEFALSWSAVGAGALLLPVSVSAAVSVSSNRVGYTALPSAITFSSATATAHGHTGTINGPGWSATALELRQEARAVVRGPAASRNPSIRALTVATPSSASRNDGSFAVTWQEQSIQAEPPSVPTLPGFNGGPP